MPESDRRPTVAASARPNPSDADCLAALFGQQTIGVCFLDAAGHIARANGAAARLFARDLPDIIGRPLTELWRPAISASRSPLEAVAEGVVCTRQGQETRARLTRTRLSGGGELLLFEDLSERPGSEVSGVLSRAFAAESVHETEHRFQSMIQAAPSYAFEAASDGSITFVSDSLCRYTGIDAEAALRGGWSDAVHPDDRDAIARRWEHAVACSESFESKHRLRAADGAYRWFIARALPTVSEGQALRWLGSLTDIDDLVQAEDALRASERVYRAIGESIDFGVWVCDPEGRNVYASDSFLQMVGMTQEECSSYGWGDVLHPEDAERTISAWKECVRTGGQWDIEHRFRGADGRWHDVLARGVPVRNERGQIECWAGINLDIARLKQAEQAVRESDRRKSEFLATLSHELRNPLAAVQYAIDLLKVSEHQPDRARAREVLERQVSHLVRLVDDLLDLTRIASNRIPLRAARMDLGSVIRQATEAWGAVIADAGQVLEVSVPDTPLWMEGDRDRLLQVATNLLSNATRYTPKGGTIRLAAERVGAQIHVTVADTGIGLAAEDLSRVFEMFVQVDDPGRGGLGIGLALVKGIVDLHGGTVEAHSRGRGHGTEFVVALPGADGRGTPELLSAGNTTPAPVPILVVDDNVDSAEMMRTLLELYGHRVMVAYTAKAALESVRSFQPVLAFLDIGLPDMNGYELANQLRADPTLAGLFLVAVTGWGQDEDRQRALAHGFDAHLTKPASPDDLLAMIVRARQQLES